MKIRFYSDLHLEFGKFNAPDPDSPETVLVLAGDIGVKLGALSFVEQIAPKYKAVIMVAGNHEFYNGNIAEVIKRWKDVAHIPNFYFLENSSVVIDGIRFLGCTLWSDYDNDNFVVKQYCKLRMNDFKMISVEVPKAHNTRKKTYFTPDIASVLHKTSLQYLKSQLLAAGMQTVVITHHSPSVIGCDSERYGVNNDLDYAYYTPLEYLMNWHDHLTHWIFGHTHKSLDMDIHGTRVLSNPRGYLGHDVNKNFNPSKQIVL